MKSRTHRSCLIAVQETSEGFYFSIDGVQCTIPQESESKAFKAAIQEIDNAIREEDERAFLRARLRGEHFIPRISYRRLDFATSCEVMEWESSRGSESATLDWIVEAVETAQHGDWKTQLVTPYFMGMIQGEQGVLRKIFVNCEGVWCQVHMDDGRVADVRPRQLVVKAHSLDDED